MQKIVAFILILALVLVIVRVGAYMQTYGIVNVFAQYQLYAGSVVCNVNRHIEDLTDIPSKGFDLNKLSSLASLLTVDILRVLLVPVAIVLLPEYVLFTNFDYVDSDGIHHGGTIGGRYD